MLAPFIRLPSQTSPCLVPLLVRLLSELDIVHLRGAHIPSHFGAPPFTWLITYLGSSVIDCLQRNPDSDWHVFTWLSLVEIR